MAQIFESTSNFQDAYKASEAQSKDGNSYESGTLKEGVAQPKDSSDGPMSTEAFDSQVTVYWPVDDTWHTASPEVNSATGITSYIVGNSSSPIYDYYIEFTTGRKGDYYFTDQTGDSYENDVKDPSGTHVTRYNSKKPTIVLVTVN